MLILNSKLLVTEDQQVDMTHIKVTALDKDP